MRRLLLATMLCAATPAWAQMNIYYHSGAWDAFDGKNETGQPVCGVGTRNIAGGQTLSLSFTLGGNDVTFTASKPGWNIPDGTNLPVIMQIGLEQPWQEQAAGSGNHVQWRLDRAAVQSFDAQFRRASSMTLTFPSGNEQPWVVPLSGSTAISNAMGRCVTDLARQANVAAPPASPAPTTAQPTQPFGAGAPPAPANNAPPSPAGSNPPPAQNDQSNAAPPPTQPAPSH